VVPRVAERGAMLAGCFGSMFPRTAVESSRLGEHPHPSLRADLSLEGEGLAGSPLGRRGGAGERRNFVAWPSWP